MNLEEKPWFNDAEYMSYVGHLLEMDELKKLDGITHHYTSTRLQHCLRVSYVSYLIAKKRGLNAKATARAGLCMTFSIMIGAIQNLLRAMPMCILISPTVMRAN